MTMGANAMELEQYRVSLHRTPQAGKPTITEAAIALSEEETTSLHKMQERIFAYMVTRCQQMDTEKKLQGLKDHIMQQKNDCEKSVIFTLGVLPDHADNQDSLKVILDHIHDLYGVGTHQVYHTDSLTRGCRCRKGCSTRRCKCFREGKLCAIGCRCRDCTNSEIKRQEQHAEHLSGEGSVDCNSESSGDDNHGYTDSSKDNSDCETD